MSMSRAADLSLGNRGRPVGYKWEGICGKGETGMKGRVVALQQRCKREYVLRNVRKKLGAMEHEWKTWTSSHTQVWVLISTCKWPALSDPHFCCQKYVIPSQYKGKRQYINCWSLCSHKILKIVKILLSLILRVYEYKNQTFFLVSCTWTK